MLHNEASVYDFELNDDMSGTRRDLGQAMELPLYLPLTLPLPNPNPNPNPTTTPNPNPKST